MTTAHASPPHDDEAGYERGYLWLVAIFIAALVATNLIFQKFFMVRLPWIGEGYEFAQSVALLAYPVTFLATDILSEAYGRKRANEVVTAGFLASIFVLGLVELADLAPSAPFGIGDETFHRVFGLSKVNLFASMSAYLAAQYVDIRVFHVLKRLTRGRHLWLRNNFSTFTSQFLDTFIVLALLATLGGASVGITWERVPKLMLDGLLFKWSFALIDTPLFYLAIGILRRRFPRNMARVDALDGAGPEAKVAESAASH